jgi:2-amino-4-hydroxy-6-hydroxymethyldihydropteridine diphosphokinase/dihydropteroate synthase
MASGAAAAGAAGADVVNDQVGELDDADEAMLATAGRLGVPIVSMHARGDARTMNSLVLGGPHFDVVEYVGAWLARRAAAAVTRHSVPAWNLMLDPGLGFAKAGPQNVELLARLAELTGGPLRGHPWLVGASRKRFLRDMDPFDADCVTSATTVVAALAGAAMVRVHNVRMAVDAIKVADAVLRARGAK